MKTKFLLTFLPLALIGCAHSVHSVQTGEQLKVYVNGPTRVLSKSTVSDADRAAIQRQVLEMDEARRELTPQP